MNVRFVSYHRVPPPIGPTVEGTGDSGSVAPSDEVTPTPDGAGDWTDAGYDDGDPVVSRVERHESEEVHAIESDGDDDGLPGGSWSLDADEGGTRVLHNAEILAVTP